MSVKPLIILGTRPEAIKLAPVIREARENRNVDPVVCSTGQHREMLAQVLDYFEIMPDVSLDLMKTNQTLSGLTSRLIDSLQEVINTTQPDCVVAQGDTTTVLTSAMLAFYNRLPFVHVEAGLRTGDLYAPWPEEYNRRVAGMTADIHCAPTQGSADNLLNEGVDSQKVHVTGNTVIDALFFARDRERANSDQWQNKYQNIGDQRLVLITGHRRENFGEGFQSFCKALASLANQHTDVQFLYPVHLNPNVQKPVHELLGSVPNIHLTDPASYPEFIWLMDRSYMIITDSGGVQEEAPSLGKPVLVTRTVTERPEAVASGAVQLVGTSFEKITRAANLLLTDKAAYQSRQIDNNPYGDGHASERIVKLIAERAWESKAAITKAA